MNKFSFKKYLLAGLAVLSLVGASGCTMQTNAKANRELDALVGASATPYLACVKLIGATEFACNSWLWKKPCVLTWQHTLAVCAPFIPDPALRNTKALAEVWDTTHP